MSKPKPYKEGELVIGRDAKGDRYIGYYIQPNKLQQSGTGRTKWVNEMARPNSVLTSTTKKAAFNG